MQADDVDRSTLGVPGESFEVPIERGKVEEFARAVHSDDPAHRGADAITPATFLTTATFVWATPESAAPTRIDLDLTRLLHGEQEFVFHGPPPRAGQVLQARSMIVDVFDKAGKRGGAMTFIKGVIEFRDEDGVLVAESRSTVIQRG